MPEDESWRYFLRRPEPSPAEPPLPEEKPLVKPSPNVIAKLQSLLDDLHDTALYNYMENRGFAQEDVIARTKTWHHKYPEYFTDRAAAIEFGKKWHEEWSEVRQSGHADIDTLAYKVAKNIRHPWLRDEYKDAVAAIPKSQRGAFLGYLNRHTERMGLGAETGAVAEFMRNFAIGAADVVKKIGQTPDIVGGMPIDPLDPIGIGGSVRVAKELYDATKTTKDLQSKKRGPVSEQAILEDDSIWPLLAQQAAREKDEVSGATWLGMTMNAAARMAPAMAVGTLATRYGGSKAGMAFWTTQYIPEFYLKVRVKGVPDNMAKNAAIAFSVPYAALEYLQMKQIMRFALPEAAKITQAARPGLATSIANTSAKFIMSLGAEATEEGAQALMDEFALQTTKGIYDVASGYMPEFDAKRMVRRAYEETIESFGPLAVLTGGSAGVANAISATSKALDRVLLDREPQRGPEYYMLQAQRRAELLKAFFGEQAEDIFGTKEERETARQYGMDVDTGNVAQAEIFARSRAQKRRYPTPIPDALDGWSQILATSTSQVIAQKIKDSLPRLMGMPRNEIVSFIRETTGLDIEQLPASTKENLLTMLRTQVVAGFPGVQREMEASVDALAAYLGKAAQENEAEYEGPLLPLEPPMPAEIDVLQPPGKRRLVKEKPLPPLEPPSAVVEPQSVADLTGPSLEPPIEELLPPNPFNQYRDAYQEFRGAVEKGTLRFAGPAIPPKVMLYMVGQGIEAFRHGLNKYTAWQEEMSRRFQGADAKLLGHIWRDPGFQAARDVIEKMARSAREEQYALPFMEMAGRVAVAEELQPLIDALPSTVRPQVKQLFKAYQEIVETRFIKRGKSVPGNILMDLVKNINIRIERHNAAIEKAEQAEFREFQKEWRLNEAELARQDRAMTHLALKAMALGERTGQAYMKNVELENRKGIYNTVKEMQLPKEIETPILRKLSRMWASSPAQQARVMESINYLIDKLNHRKAVTEYRDAVKAAVAAKFDQKRQLELVGLTRSVEAQMSEMPAEEIKGVADEISELTKRYLRELALRSKLLREKRGRKVSAAVRELIEKHGKRYAVKLNELEPPAGALQRGLGEGNWWGNIIIWSHETLVENLCQGREGVLYDILQAQPWEGERKAARVLLDCIRHWQAGLDALGVTMDTLIKWSEQPAIVRLSGPQVKGVPADVALTNGEVLNILGLISDPNRRQQLFRNVQKGVQLERRGKKKFGIHPEDVAALEQAAPFALQVIALFKQINTEYLSPLVAKTYLNQKGHPLDIDPEYWPSHRIRAPKWNDNPADLQKQYIKHKLGNMGKLKPRVGGTDYFGVTNGVDYIVQHFNAMSQYVGKAEITEEAMTLLDLPQFATALREGMRHGDRVLRTLKDNISDYQGMDTLGKHWLNLSIRYMLRLIQESKLAFKPWIWVYQPVSLSNAMLEMSRAEVKMAVNPKILLGRSAAEIDAITDRYSAILSMRRRGSSHDLFTPGIAAKPLHRAFGAQETAYMKYGLEALRKMDTKAIRTIIRIKLASAEARGLTGEEMYETAFREAEEVTRRSQPTRGPLDSSMFIRWIKQYPALAALFMFRSQPAQNYNQNIRAINEFRHLPPGQRDLKAVTKLMITPLLSVVTTAFTISLIRGLAFKGMDALFGLDDDETWGEEFWGFVSDSVDTMLGSWITGDTVVTTLKGRLESKRREYGGRDIPFIDAREQIGDLMADLIEAAPLIIEGRFSEKPVTDTVLNAMEVGAYRGFPDVFRQITRRAFKSIRPSGSMRQVKQAKRAK